MIGFQNEKAVQLDSAKAWSSVGQASCLLNLGRQDACPTILPSKLHFALASQSRGKTCRLILGYSDRFGVDLFNRHVDFPLVVIQVGVNEEGAEGGRVEYF
jgi:hypothetical protein